MCWASVCCFRCFPLWSSNTGGSKPCMGRFCPPILSFKPWAHPILRRLSDSIGRKPVLMISQAGTLLSWLIFKSPISFQTFLFFGFALPLIVIACSRVLDGITGGNNAVAQAYLTDITTKKEKDTIFGTVGGIVGVGFIIGLRAWWLLGLWSIRLLRHGHWRSCLSTVTLIGIAVGLKESLKQGKIDALTNRNPFSFRCVSFIRSNASIQPPSLSISLPFEKGFSM